MSIVPAYRQHPDEMTKAAESIGCRLWVPYTGRDFTWEAYPAVIIVTNNSTETRWWQALGAQATACCLILGRLQWKSTIQGQTALYFAPEAEAFKAVFTQFGLVVQRAEGTA